MIALDCRLLLVICSGGSEPIVRFIVVEAEVPCSLGTNEPGLNSHNHIMQYLAHSYLAQYSDLHTVTVLNGIM